jgi:class 3 adenylate cyclase
MHEFLEKHQQENHAGMQIWDLKMGIHTGPVTANIIGGKKKASYDIKGDSGE